MFSLPTLNPVAAAARFGGAKRNAFLSLFGSGAYKGVYFDPSDLTTIYTDRAGTTLATMPGLGSAITIGKWLDKSGGGNHMSVTADSKRPTLSARVNMLLATDTLATQNITGLIAGNYKLAFSGAGSIVLSGVGSGTYTAGSHTITCTAGTLTLTVSGSVTSADFRRACDAIAGIPAYQRVVDALTYDTTGFPLFALFDGTDDSGTTPSIDFTGTDKMTVFAGVTKLTTGSGAIVELGATVGSTSGTFGMFANGSNTDDWYFGLNGSAVTLYAPRNYVPPLSVVESCAYDIAGAARATEIFPRINGVLDQTTPLLAASAGTGNFTSNPLNIGARNNVGSFFNGRLYHLVVVGRACSAGEITAAESAINAKMGRVY